MYVLILIKNNINVISTTTTTTALSEIFTKLLNSIEIYHQIIYSGKGWYITNKLFFIKL